MATSAIARDIVLTRRNFFINTVKAPLMKSLVRIALSPKGSGLLSFLTLLYDVWVLHRTLAKYPEPTKKNTKKKLTHALIDIWDEFFLHENNPGRLALFRFIRKASVCEVEYNFYYSQRIKWFTKKLVAMYISGELPSLKSFEPSNNWLDKATQAAAIVERRRQLRQLSFGLLPEEEE